LIKTIIYTAFALVAFAFNSILCRLALRGGEADAAGFTVVRLTSGAVALVVISYLFAKRGRLRGSDGDLDDADIPAKSTSPAGRVSDSGTWISAFLLFAYAVCFSFAYLGLTAATGALILFGSVQMTMVAAAIIKGERPTWLEWAGLAAAIGGLVYLVSPGLAAPPLTSSALMAIAGMSWGIYTLRGRTGGEPLANTAGNFIRATPFAAVLAVVYLSNLRISNYGILLAAISGAVASGIGYTLWYAAIKHHTATRAAVLQLAVPVIAAGFGIVMLGEPATLQTAAAAALIIGGIGLSIWGRSR